jgi:hypothetical protein
MSLLQSSKLQNFLQDNKDAISYDSGFDPKDIEDRLKQAKQNHDFVPLADVPDIIWKNLPSKVKGGRDTQPAPHGSTGPEHPNHYADVDQIWPAKSKTMLQLCSGSGSGNVNVQFWSGYYAALQKTKDRDQGLLPFRVWQFYKEMVKYVTAQDVERFLCAAGVLSHYVGDACQPLHGSMYSDGYSDQPQTIVRHHKATGEAYEDTTWPGQGVHSTYEDKMVDDHAPKLFQLVQGQLSSLAPFQLITGGQAAAQLTVDLMNFAQDHLAPKTIVDTYVQAGGKKNKKTSDALFKKCGTVTARLWLEGARTLACLWDSAWEEGNGKSLASAALKVIPTTRLQDIYENDDKFAPSKYLKDIPPYL